MVSTNEKGAAIELIGIKYLENEDYKVHRCVRTGVKRGGRWISQSNDVFGCIDLIAKKKGERTRWIQVTADGGIGRKKADLAEVPWDPLFDSVEIWRWKGKKMQKGMTQKEWKKNQCFQIYRFENDFELVKGDLLWV